MKSRLIAAAALAFAYAHAAQAGVVFDSVTCGSCAPANISGPGTTGIGQAGQSFMTPTNDPLRSITVSLSLLADNPSDGGSILVFLTGDDQSNGTAPGMPDAGNMAMIGTIPDSLLNSVSSGSMTEYTLQSSNFLLTPTVNNEYWVVLDFADGGSTAEWVLNSDNSGLGVTNQYAWDNAQGSYVANGSVSGQGAYQMVVDTPEPATLAMLGFALTGLGMARRRNRRAAGKAG